jgi:hypothetical protein
MPVGCIDGTVVGSRDGNAEKMFVGLDERMFEGASDGASEGDTLGTRERSNNTKGGNVPRCSTRNSVLGGADGLSEGEKDGLVEGLADGDADDASLAWSCMKSMYAWFATSFCSRLVSLIVTVLWRITSDLAAWDLPILNSPLALASGV